MIVVVEHGENVRVKRLSLANRWVERDDRVRLVRVRLRKQVHANDGAVLNLEVQRRGLHAHVRVVQLDRNLASRDDHGDAVEFRHGFARLGVGGGDRHDRRVQTLRRGAIGIVHIVSFPSLAARRNVKRHLHQRILLRRRVVVVKLQDDVALPDDRRLGDVLPIDLKRRLPTDLKHRPAPLDRDVAPVPSVHVHLRLAARAPQLARRVLRRVLRVLRPHPSQHERPSVRRSHSQHPTRRRVAPSHLAHLPRLDLRLLLLARARRRSKPRADRLAQRQLSLRPAPASERARRDGKLRAHLAEPFGVSIARLNRAARRLEALSRCFLKSKRSRVRVASSAVRASFARSRRSRTAATAFGSFIAFALVPDVPLVARFPIVISFQS
mmetsp:Transcript_6384/g.25554  ORF Transcript_6384/g.25554 Transcript_6384/m.25554 type:complete len:382 (+) Transcript_6384:1056-2201(+)